ncbi:MAG TPA: SAM-dependent methyltransferase [Rhodocyclaceae bacterium]|nr:SAM-dependent methyltransferase [Rhodocyclaceae bacterium]
MTAGRLFLIPASLGGGPWQATVPPLMREAVCGLDYFIAENARSARAELKRLGVTRPLQSIEIREIPRDTRVPAAGELLAPVREGRCAGLISEAGCPAVADPGAELVRLAHQDGIRVVPLVGPSSILLALMASGLNGQRFAFHGYLPIPEAARRAAIADLEAESRRRGQTQVFIETPYRNAALFRTLIETCAGATLLCVATEITLESERISTRSIAEWKRNPPPEIERRPTVFLLLAGPLSAG